MKDFLAGMPAGAVVIPHLPWINLVLYALSFWFKDMTTRVDDRVAS